jgi:hypothetical protein
VNTHAAYHSPPKTVSWQRFVAGLLATVLCLGLLATVCLRLLVACDCAVGVGFGQILRVLADCDTVEGGG